MKTHCFVRVLGTWTACFWASISLTAQGTVEIQNPSFEQLDQVSSRVWPSRWTSAEFEGNSPAKLHSNFFKGFINKRTQHGDLYMSLMTYDNYTWESIYQILHQPILKDSVYTFSLWMAHVDALKSISKTTGERSDYNSPPVLRIWGLNTVTKDYEMLAESEPVTNTKWREFNFCFKPTHANYDGFQLSAYYAEGHLNTSGNILIDQLSNLHQAKRGTIQPIVPKVRKDTVPVKNQLPPALLDPINRPLAIQLTNPSFEADGEPGFGTPKGWRYVGNCSTCKPVVEPRRASLDRKLKAAKGKFYVSMLTYEGGKYEAIGQHLSQPLQKDSAYSFRVKAAFSKHYEDPLQKFPNPVRLCVWGYDEETLEQEMLAQTIVISHGFWYEYEFLLTPRKRNYDSIALSACHDPQKPQPYNGNVLIDDCSPITRLHTK
jgi:hypothetical protein